MQPKQLTSKYKAFCAVISLAVISLGIHSFTIYMTDYSTPPCNYLPQFTWFTKVGQGLLIMVGHNILPLSITCVCYIIIVILVRINKRKRQQLQQVRINSRKNHEFYMFMSEDVKRVISYQVVFRKHK